MARECLCIEENRKKTLREIERDIELSHVHSQHGWVFTSMPKVNPSPQYIKPFYCTSCFKIYCAVLSDCSAFVGLSYIVQINKDAISYSLLFCFVQFLTVSFAFNYQTEHGLVIFVMV